MGRSRCPRPRGRTRRDRGHPSLVCACGRAQRQARAMAAGSRPNRRALRQQGGRSRADRKRRRVTASPTTSVRQLMAEYRPKNRGLERVLGTGALFSTAYGNVGSSIYYALGLVAWGQMLNYIITVAISAFFVPHYLGVFWEPLGRSPADVVGGIVVVVILGVINVVGVKESAGLNVFLALADFCTQLVLVAIGIVLVFSPDTLVDNVDLWNAPTLSNFLIAIPVGMVAYTGIETISNMAEEARDYGKTIPRGMAGVVVAVFAIYTFLPAVALSAMPVVNGETALALSKEEGGYADDPILGVVANMELGAFQHAAEIYVGILAATILFIATNAGMIGVSRLTYSMGQYRQLPERLRALHPRF